MIRYLNRIDDAVREANELAQGKSHIRFGCRYDSSKNYCFVFLDQT